MCHIGWVLLSHLLAVVQSVMLVFRDATVEVPQYVARGRLIEHLLARPRANVAMTERRTSSFGRQQRVRCSRGVAASSRTQACASARGSRSAGSHQRGGRLYRGVYGCFFWCRPGNSLQDLDRVRGRVHRARLLAELPGTFVRRRGRTDVLCETCRVYQPLRAKHCLLCDRCRCALMSTLHSGEVVRHGIRRANV